MKLVTVFFTFCTICFFTTSGWSQIERINQTIPQIEAESHLRFLASDEMRGRNTGSVELTIAGRYIAEQFRKSGLAPLGDMDQDYLQHVPLYTTTAPTTAQVVIQDRTFTFGTDLAMLSGQNGSMDAALLLVDDINEIDSNQVKGKIAVIVLQDLMAAFRNQDRVQILKDAGCAGLLEIYVKGQYPWPVVMRALNRQRVSIGEVQKEDPSFSHLWVQDTANWIVDQLTQNETSTATLNIEGYAKTPVYAFNVVGKIEGTDPELSKEHIVMCAHYDHVGVQANDGQDSIYNGTRDNGIGTTGVINAAKYFAQYPTKRSIIFIALTGEEKGLLGSHYYADHPKIPLQETVFTLNIDNSGYTDTEHITLLDTNRTNIDALVYQAASEVGLKVMGDRIPSQNYYERSDQVSFASKGVPAVNFKMSMEAFDDRISKYYHQPSDQVDNVDLDYIYKYWRAYIRSAELIGNWDQTPYWVPGDKFEAAGDELYQK